MTCEKEFKTCNKCRVLTCEYFECDDPEVESEVLVYRGKYTEETKKAVKSPELRIPRGLFPRDDRECKAKEILKIV